MHEVGEHVAHVAGEQVRGGVGNLAGEIRGTDDGHSPIGHLRADAGSLDVAAQVAGRTVDDDGTALEAVHAGLGQQHRRLAAGNLGRGDDDVEPGCLLVDGRLLGGLLGGKISSKVQLSFVASLALIFVLVGIFAPTDVMGAMPVFTGTGFGMVEVPVGVIFFTLCGLCTSVMWGTIFNLAVEGLGKYTSMGSGIFMVMVCGGGILPLIQGGVADFAGYLSSYWVVVAGLAYMLFYALVGSKNVNKDIPVEE